MRLTHGLLMDKATYYVRCFEDRAITLKQYETLDSSFYVHHVDLSLQHTIRAHFEYFLEMLSGVAFLKFEIKSLTNFFWFSTVYKHKKDKH